MKKLTKSLTRFTLFSAAACAILFGLPALATRHPFILLAVSIAILILVTIANFKATKETDRALQAHRRTVQHPHTHKAA